MDTIAALATASQPAGVAVIRISGTKTEAVLAKIFQSKKTPIANPRELIFGEVVDTSSLTVLDQSLAVFFPNPNSFTGEDVAEIQFHGSPLLGQKILQLIYREGVRAAEPGEFTKRSFLNSKLDLLQAEAVADLIAASSDAELQIASDQLAGKFSNVVEDLGEPLKDILAELEAWIDFPEEDIEPATINKLAQATQQANQRIQNLLKTFDYGQVVKDGYQVLICGRPNAGKSSLLNLLLRRNRAIVSDVSGTTRDLIEELAVIDGQKFVFCDSAGITETTDKVEKIGIELALDRLQTCDLVLLVIDAQDSEEQARIIYQQIASHNKPVWIVSNKQDLNKNVFSKLSEHVFPLSTVDSRGLTELEAALVRQVKSINQSTDSSIVVYNERQRSNLLLASQSLEKISDLVKTQPLEIVSAELRIALSYLEQLVGAVDTENILGRIFSKFCIGK